MFVIVLLHSKVMRALSNRFCFTLKFLVEVDIIVLGFLVKTRIFTII